LVPFSTSSNVGNSHFPSENGAVTSDETALAGNCLEMPDNKQHDSSANPSLHDHQHNSRKFCKHCVQVHKRKRKCSCVTGDDQLMNSDVSCVDSELAEKHNVVSSNDSTIAAELKIMKQSTEKADCEDFSGFVSDTSESPDGDTVNESIEFRESDSVNTKTNSYVCQLCGMTFDARQEFCNHVSEVHTRNPCDGTGDNQSSPTVPTLNTVIAEKRNEQQDANETCKRDVKKVYDICGWKKSSVDT